MEQPTITPTSKPLMRPFMDLFRDAWARYNQRFIMLMGISLLANAGAVGDLVYHQLARLAVAPGNLLAAQIAIWLIGAVLSIWGYLALYASVCRPTQVASVSQAFRVGGPFFLSSLTTGILVGAWVLLGLILLILPGIYWATLYSVAIFVVFKEGLTNTTALARSKQLVKPYWSDVLWRQLGFGLMVVVPATAITMILPLGFKVLPPAVELLANDAAVLILNVLLYPAGLLFLTTIYENLVELQAKPA